MCSSHIQVIDLVDRELHSLEVFEVIVQIRDGGLYQDFKVGVIFNARALFNPGKVRRRVFGLTSQTY